MKPLIALMVAALLATAAFGTAQVPDKLILDGKEVPLFENPLEFLWVDEDGTPVLLSLVFAEPSTTPEERQRAEALEARRPEIFRKGGGSSANWRGYVATWQIDGDRLMLAKIEQEHWKDAPPEDREKLKSWRSERVLRAVPIENVLPGKTLPLFATWYSGRLKIPRGEMTRYVHMGYGSEYEQELLIAIKKGVVVARAEISNEGKNAYRSIPDLEWCAMGKEVEDKGGWIDARLLGTSRGRALIEMAEEFRTRGVFFKLGDGRAALVVLGTMKTPEVDFLIPILPEGTGIAGGSHVEITGRLVRGDREVEFRVTAIRDLQPGETMHAASFPEEWEKLQAEEAAEKAAEAKKAAALIKTE